MFKNFPQTRIVYIGDRGNVAYFSHFNDRFSNELVQCLFRIQIIVIRVAQLCSMFRKRNFLALLLVSKRCTGNSKAATKLPRKLFYVLYDFEFEKRGLFYFPTASYELEWLSWILFLFRNKDIITNETFNGVSLFILGCPRDKFTSGEVDYFPHYYSFLWSLWWHSVCQHQCGITYTCHLSSDSILWCSLKQSSCTSSVVATCSLCRQRVVRQKTTPTSIIYLNSLASWSTTVCWIAINEYFYKRSLVKECIAKWKHLF